MSKIKTALSALAAVAISTLSLGLGAAPAQAANNCGSFEITPIHSATFYIDSSAGNLFDSQYIGYKVKNNTGSSVSGRDLVINSFTGPIGFATNESDTRTLGTIANGATKNVYFLASTATTGDSGTDTVISLSIKNSSTVVCTTSDTITAIEDVLSASANKILSFAVTPADATVVAGQDVTVQVNGDSGNIGQGPDGDYPFIFSPVTIQSSFDPAHYRLKSFTYSGPNGCSFSNDIYFPTLNNCDGLYSVIYTFTTLAGSDQSIASQIQGQSYVASGNPIKHAEGVPVELPKVLAAQKIVYKGNGGTGSMADTVGGGGLTVDDNAFTYDCHIFEGFNTQADGKGTDWAEAASYTDAGTITLYAQWSVDPTCSPEELAAAEDAAQLAATGSQTSLPIGIAGIAAVIAGALLLRRKRA